MPDKETLADGDTGFIGVNPRMDPASLKQGMASDAKNVIFRNGVAETRPGVQKPAWLNNIKPESTFKEINPWGAIYGAGTFKDPNANEFVLLAVDGDVYFCRENNDPRIMSLPTGVKVLEDVTFTQAFSKVLMFRGVGLAPLVMNTLDAGFVDLVDHWSSATTYTASTSEVAHGPWKAITSITHSGGTATVTTTAEHGYKTGMDITVRNAVETEFNGRFNITVTSASVFTYAGGTGTTATGTITCSNQQDYWKADAGYSASNEPGVTNWTQTGLILPNADIAEFIQNRVVVGTSYNSTTFNYTSQKKDFLFATDILDHKHVFFTSQFRINQGSDDVLVDILKMNENQLAIFKTKSVHLLTNFIVTDVSTGTSGLESSLVLQTLIPEYGASGPRATVLVGQDVYFYAGRRGVLSLRQTEQGKVQGVDLPLSEPIQPLIDRIDPRYEGKIRMAYMDNRLWIAAPLDDGSDGNNCILQFDFLNRQWSGRYDGTAIRVKEFFKAYFSGSERLFFTSEDGFVNLLGESDHGDEVRDTDRENNIGVEEITTSITTRGYHHNDLNLRFFKTARFSVGTWNPQFSASLVMDGANERQSLVTDRTKSRTNYYRPFDQAPWVTSNVNGDHDTPYREDYTSDISPSEDISLATEGDDTMLTEGGDTLLTNQVSGVFPGTDFNPFRFQETQETFKVATREGRYGQLELTNNQGRIQLKQVILTTEAGQQGTLVKS